MRPIPVSTSTWQRAGRRARSASAERARANSRSHTVGSSWWAMASRISLGSSGDSTMIGSRQPAWRTWMPSWSVATPKQATPSCSAARTISTAPWP